MEVYGKVAKRYNLSMTQLLTILLPYIYSPSFDPDGNSYEQCCSFIQSLGYKPCDPS